MKKTVKLAAVLAPKQIISKASSSNSFQALAKNTVLDTVAEESVPVLSPLVVEEPTTSLSPIVVEEPPLLLSPIVVPNNELAVSTTAADTVASVSKDPLDDNLIPASSSEVIVDILILVKNKQPFMEPSPSQPQGIELFVDISDANIANSTQCTSSSLDKVSLETVAIVKYKWADIAEAEDINISKSKNNNNGKKTV